MSTTATTLTIIERAFLVAELTDSLTDLGLVVHSASAATWPGLTIQVANEDEVDRAAEHLELVPDQDEQNGNYTRQGVVRGTPLRVYSGRTRKRHSCPACTHSGAVSA